MYRLICLLLILLSFTSCCAVKQNKEKNRLYESNGNVFCVRKNNIEVIMWSYCQDGKIEIREFRSDRIVRKEQKKVICQLPEIDKDYYNELSISNLDSHSILEFSINNADTTIMEKFYINVNLFKKGKFISSFYKSLSRDFSTYID